MKILLINSIDRGGAAKACIRLHLGLLKQQIESKILLQEKADYSIPHTYKFADTTPVSVLNITQKIRRKLTNIAKELGLIKDAEGIQKGQFLKQHYAKGLEMYSFPTSYVDITQNPLYQEADIIHFHWVANFLDWTSFFAKNQKPILWTLHDQNPFLGGEHYAEKFLGIDPQGYPIQRQYTEVEIQENNKWLEVKKKTLQNTQKLHIVAPSKWLLNSSMSSELFQKFPHEHIPNGFPTDIFKPYNATSSKEILNIPPNKKVILFVADSIHSQRKGYQYLLKALQKIANHHNFVLCAIGTSSHLPTNAGLEVIELGRIADERLMAMAYSAADVFIIPSLEDNFPNTMIEALLCGTPVIGFPTGGIVDAIQNEQTGYICPEISVPSLKNTIEKFLQNPEIFNRNAIAQEAKQKYALEVQAATYIKLYQKILG